MRRLLQIHRLPHIAPLPNAIPCPAIGKMQLHPDAGLEYLERRVREESAGDYGVLLRQAQDKSVKKEEAETVIDKAELGARVARRKAALGIVDPAASAPVKGRNSGKNRTASKKALLKAIEDIGGKW